MGLVYKSAHGGNSHGQQTCNHANFRLNRSLLACRALSRGISAYQHESTDPSMVMGNLCLDLGLVPEHDSPVVAAVLAISMPMKTSPSVFALGAFHPMVIYRH